MTNQTQQLKLPILSFLGVPLPVVSLPNPSKKYYFSGNISPGRDVIYSTATVRPYCGTAALGCVRLQYGLQEGGQNMKKPNEPKWYLTTVKMQNKANLNNYFTNNGMVSYAKKCKTKPISAFSIQKHRTLKKQSQFYSGLLALVSGLFMQNKAKFSLWQEMQNKANLVSI